MKLFTTILTAALMAAAPAIHSQSYPDKPVTLIVGFPPGGGVDIVARQLAETLSESLGQRMVVENRAGAAGNIAMEYVARAKPDGYTLLMGNLGMLTANPVLYPKLSFDPAKDFAPVARVVITPLLAAVPATLPAQSVQQFIAMAKAKPNEMSFGSGGNGNINHLAGELLKLQTGTQIKHVPYKGSAPALTDLMGGHIQLVIDGFNVVQPSVASGKARAIAITGDTRSPVMPDVPTMKEFGLGDLVIYGWQGVLAPAGTPPSIIEKLTQEVARALANPALKARLSGQGTEPSYLNPVQFRSYITGEQVRWANVISSAKITLD